jgi:Zn-dependent M28 family amino/carboxypeptidase
MPGQSFEGSLPAADAALRSSAEQLRADVQHLAGSIGERNPGRPEALRQSADWIERELALAGYTPRRHGFEAAGQRYYNLEAELAGGARVPELVIVGAHYDSAPGAPGANDNGSGVAATLALARALRHERFPRGLRFTFYVNEEEPHFQSETMGSLQSATRSRQSGERIAAMLSLETLGYFSAEPGSQRYPFPLSWFYPARGDFVAFVGNLASAALLRRSIATFRAHEAFPSEGGCLPERLPGVGWSDHWAYWQRGYPAIMVTDTALFRYPHYHTQRDTADALDYERLARVVRGLSAVVTELATGP